MRVAVDIDNTICDTLAVLRRCLRIPLVAEQSRDWSPYGADAAFWERYGGDVFEAAQPYFGAPEAMGVMARRAGVAYVTARPASAASVTARWLRRHGFPDGPMIFDCAADKPLAAKRLGCLWAIEDDPRQIEAYRTSGIPVLVPRRGYNLQAGGADLFEEWYEVLMRLPRSLEAGVHPAGCQS